MYIYAKTGRGVRKRPAEYLYKKAQERLAPSHFILLVGGDGLASPLGGDFSRPLRLFLAELVDVLTACRDGDAIGEGVSDDVVVLHGIFLSGFGVFLPFVDLIIAQIGVFVKHFFIYNCMPCTDESEQCQAGQKG